MWMNAEDARSDFMLVAATAAIVPLIHRLAVNYWFYPSWGDDLFWILELVWITAAAIAMPWWLARYRERTSDLYGGEGETGSFPNAVLIALPILVVGLLRMYSVFGTSLRTLGGNAVFELPGDPTMGSSSALFDRLIVIALVAVSAYASVIMLSMLTVRARDGFRQVEITVVEALRTFGMGGAAAALVFGALRSIAGDVSWSLGLGTAVALAGLVLLADRLVYRSMTTTRMTILAPAITSAILHVLASGGLISNADPLSGLWLGSLGFGVTVVLASLLETRKAKLAFLLAILIATLYPSCMHPLSGLQVFSLSC